MANRRECNGDSGNNQTNVINEKSVNPWKIGEISASNTPERVRDADDG